jgi:PKD repeat protein
MPLLLANETSVDRPWLGLFRLVAIYSRCLDPAEVLHNYEAGSGNNEMPAAEFAILPGDEYGVAPHTVEFDPSDSVASGGIASYFWEFGDGQTSSRPNPTYTYANAGVYTVSLTITDGQGQTSKVTKERLITVVALPLPPLPAEYARFILVEVQSATIKAFGIQYPDLRCSLLWNDEPSHMLVYSEIGDVRHVYTQNGDMELIWVDALESE